jgi:predicted N-formylglutamate amidohydrolase
VAKISPVRVLRPKALSAFLLTCEHASNAMPPGLVDGSGARGVLATHEGYDIGALEVARGLSGELRATLVAARWSRLLVDLNRPVTDPELIRAEAGGVGLPWNRRLAAGARERRFAAYHAPYHQEIDRQIVRRLLRGVRPTLLSLHTFTPRLGRSVRRFDVGILYIDDRTLAWRLARLLRAAGLSVRYNQPYSGPEGLMYAIDRHGSHHGLPCVEIEVNQALLDSPRGVERIVAALAGALREASSRTGNGPHPG